MLLNYVARCQTPQFFFPTTRSSVEWSVWDLDIHVMGDILTNCKMDFRARCHVEMNTNGPSRFQFLGPDRNTVLPKFSTPVPREDDRLAWLQRQQSKTLVFQIEGLDRPVEG